MVLSPPVNTAAFKTVDPDPANDPIVSVLFTFNAPGEVTTTAPVFAIADPPDKAKVPALTVVVPV